MRPFRFGIHSSSLPANGWIEWLRRIEGLGYSAIHWPDHFGPQIDPVVAMAAAAGVTKRLRLGSLVYCVDYRHPVVYAKAAASIHALSGGRHEFGIGAGWMEDDYSQAGIHFDKPSVRIERLDEALQIIKSVWTEERTNFTGKHYQIRGIERTAELQKGERPRIHVGGGGRRLLTVAGRHADIVSIVYSIRGGSFNSDSIRDGSISRFNKKVGWIRKAAETAGKDPDAIELGTMMFQPVFTDDPETVIKEYAKKWDVTYEEAAEFSELLVGTPSAMKERLKQLREDTGINYIVIQARDVGIIEEFANSVAKPLTQVG